MAQPTNIRSLFWSVLDLPAAQRSARLGAHPDRSLADEVRSLIDFHETTLTRSSPTSAVTSSLSGSSLRRVGGCELEKPLGFGGMGIVYLANQERPKRQVAIKVIRTDTRSEISESRFSLEAEALARLNHPGIAKIFSMGTESIENQRFPYIIMELIEGACSIDEYVEAERLSRRDRYALFCDVCDAVQHAHDRGVLHRDLKPSNILIDREGAPKVIDFGIAHFQDPSTRPDLRLTNSGFVGTPAFIAPELYGDPSHPYDVKCDVFSLGVVLHVMLTGKMPRREGTAAAVEAIERWDHHGRDDRTVDCILRKAIACDPMERYTSVAELLADVSRVQNHHPVAAAPPSLLQSAALVARRHTAIVCLVGVILLSLLVGMTTTTVFAVWESRARSRADLETERLNQTMSYLVDDVFSLADPRLAGRGDRTIGQALDTASGTVQQIPDRRVRATVHNRFAEIYAAIGEQEDALANSEASIELLTGSNATSDRAELARAHLARGQSLSHLGHYDDAYLAVETALALFRSATGPASFETAESLAALASLCTVRGQPGQALEYAVSAVEIASGHLAPGDQDFVRMRWYLAQCQENAGHVKAARETLERTLHDQRAVMNGDSPYIATTMNNLGLLCLRDGAESEALTHLESALALRRRALPAAHPDIQQSIASLGVLSLRTGKADQAVLLLEEALGLYEGSFGPDHPYVGRMLISTAAAHLAVGNPRQASASAERASLIFRGPEHNDPVREAAALSVLGEALTSLGRFDDAAEALDAAERLLDDRVGVNPRVLEQLEERRAALREARGRSDGDD